MGFGSAFSGGGGGLGRVFGKNTGAITGAAIGGPVGALAGFDFDQQRDSLAALRDAQMATEGQIAKELARRQKNVKAVRGLYGIGTSKTAVSSRARLGSQINQQVGNAREAGLADVTAAGSEGLRKANIAAANTGTLGSSLGNRFAATAVQGYGGARQELASGLGGLRQGAIAALASARSGMERTLAGGAPLSPELAATQQAGALRQYALGVPVQTANNMLGTLGSAAINSSIASASGTGAPDILGLAALTGSLGRNQKQEQKP